MYPMLNYILYGSLIPISLGAFRIIDKTDLPCKNVQKAMIILIDITGAIIFAAWLLLRDW